MGPQISQTALDPALNRLSEAAKHWGTAVAEYHDPENFRIALNACIQSIRNITFALQSQKSAIANFEGWYTRWQSALRNDFIMKWCVEARNQIVKQSDLRTNSVALASLVNDYREPSTNMFKVSPFSTSHEIALQFRDRALPKPLSEYGYLHVERRWVVDGLPRIELLEGLGYALSLLQCLLLDAVSQRGPAAFYGADAPPTVEDFDEGVIDDRYLPEFATSFREARSAWLKLSSSEFVQLVDIPHETSQSEQERSNVKYLLAELLKGIDKTKKDLKSQVHFFLTIGKRILEVDGYHWPHVFLFDRKGRLSIITPEFPDHEDKLIVWRHVAKHAKREKATIVIAVAEAWQAPFDPSFPNRRPEHSSQRIEALHAAALTNRGEGYAVAVPFWREEGKISFGEEREMKVGGLSFFEPFRRIWQKTMRTPKANKGMEPTR